MGETELTSLARPGVGPFRRPTSLPARVGFGLTHHLPHPPAHCTLIIKPNYCGFSQPGVPVPGFTGLRAPRHQSQRGGEVRRPALLCQLLHRFNDEPPRAAPDAATHPSKPADPIPPWLAGPTTSQAGRRCALDLAKPAATSASGQSHLSWSMNHTSASSDHVSGCITLISTSSRMAATDPADRTTRTKSVPRLCPEPSHRHALFSNPLQPVGAQAENSHTHRQQRTRLILGATSPGACLAVDVHAERFGVLV